jgi:serine/threonine protein kinase
VEKLLGEGAFSYVYLVSDLMSTTSSNNAHESHSDHQQQQQENVSNNNTVTTTTTSSNANLCAKMVLKVTAVQSQEQREITQKETVLLRSLSHPNIIQLVDSFSTTSSNSKMHHHMLLMEYMPEGHALHVIQNMMQNQQRYTLASLIVAFGQICNAVSYLHAQRPPITHRDLKLENFLVSNHYRTYKLCDFGSAVIGHIPLSNSAERAHAEIVLQRTTTPMYRAPEMVDLYMCPKLTQSTDVWALGCCLYAMAFFKHCFGGGASPTAPPPTAATAAADVTTTIGNSNPFLVSSSSAAAVASGGGSINLAILSGNYKIPTDTNNPYPESVTHLIHRMLTLDCNKRADMSEVIKSLSAIYGNKSTKSSLQYNQKQNSSTQRRHYKPLDSSTQSTASSKLKNSRYKSNNNVTCDSNAAEKKEEKCGIYRTDGQGQISADMATLSIKPVVSISFF